MHPWINRSMLAALAMVSVLATTTEGSFYALLVGAQGPDQATFDGDVAALQAQLTGGKWKGYGLPGHTVRLSSAAAGQASVGAVQGALAGLAGLIAVDPDPNKFLLVWIASHGGNSVVRAGEDPPPANTALNAADEFVRLTNVGAAAGQYYYDDVMREDIAAIAGLNQAMIVMDACKGGGFWGGIDADGVGNRGDLEQLAGLGIATSFGASAAENRNAPLVSRIRPALVNLLANAAGSVTTGAAQTAMAFAEAGYVGNRRAIETEEDEFGDIVMEDLEFFDPFDDDVYSGNIAFAIVPEPASFVLLMLGFPSLVLQRRRNC